jgi:signal transduction histidine kinase
MNPPKPTPRDLGQRPAGAGVGVLGPTGYLALAVGIVFLIVIAGSSVWLSIRNHEALDAAARERDVLFTIEELTASVERAETGQRGFLLTGRDAYLEPFYHANQRIPGLVAKLEPEVDGDPAAAGLLSELEPVIADKLAELRETIDLAKAGKRDAALALVGTDRGQGDTEAIRSITARMAQREQAVVGAQFDAINERGRVLVLMDTAGLAGLVLLAVVIAFGIRRYVTALRGTQAELEVANRGLEASNVNLERTVQERTADLVEANEEIQRFAYIVSHDLRAPLVNIMGFTSELEAAAKALRRFAGEVDEREPGTLSAEVAGAVDDDIPEAIRFIKASTSKMDRLISAILTLSREGRRVLSDERLDMKAVLTSIADTVRHQATDSDTEIRIGEMPALVMDRVAVEQIFGNLLDNALKYLKPNRPGVIRIGGRMEGRFAVFEVEDNGRGIAPRDHERIFELFRRAGDQSVPGEGIGLAHVRALVRRLGGKIECESVLDQGTVFRIHLPVPDSRLASHRSGSVAA